MENINENIAKLFRNNTGSTIGWTIFGFVLFYLFGSILFGPIFARQKKVDLSKIGSGNTGATNARRALGNKLGFVVILCDIIKIIIPYYICVILMRYATGASANHLILPFALIGGMVGQTFPVFFKFKGGKGVTVFGASLLAWNWMVALVAIAGAVISIGITKMVSLSAMAVSTLLVGISFIPFFWQPGASPVNLFLFESQNFLFPIVFAAFYIVIIFRHKENLKRLKTKTESKESFKQV